MCTHCVLAWKDQISLGIKIESSTVSQKVAYTAYLPLQNKGGNRGCSSRLYSSLSYDVRSATLVSLGMDVFPYSVGVGLKTKLPATVRFQSRLQSFSILLPGHQFCHCFCSIIRLLFFIDLKNNFLASFRCHNIRRLHRTQLSQSRVWSVQDLKRRRAILASWPSDNPWTQCTSVISRTEIQ